MRFRQEQVVFALTVLLLGFLVYTGLGGAGTKSSRSSRPQRPPELVRHVAPDTARALPREGRDPARMERALFEPPRDTRPLPPLEFEPPPMRPLAALRPPAAHGPGPRNFGRFLRQSLGPTAGPEPELFTEEVASEGDSEGFEALSESSEGLTAEERIEQIASYRRIYDWIKTPSYHWGQIRNPDRFGLAERPDEAILWVEFDPATGQERFGHGTVEIPRERVDGLGFAQTVENEIELRKREFRGELTPGRYPLVMAFADWCVTQRLEASNALATAEEMYLAAQPISGGQSRPRLGLALCYEAGFQFEKAFGVYHELVEGGYEDDAGTLAMLARLEDRFRLFQRAEEHFQLAERYGRTEWEVQWLYGRHLLARGRAAEALEHFQQAGRFEPSAPELSALRASIRTYVGHAHLMEGDAAEAASWYAKALQADPTFQEAVGGLLAVTYLTGPEGLDGHAAVLDENEVDGAGFEVLAAGGLVALAEGRLADAKDKLELAAEADPLRAYVAWRALSFLAEAAGYPEEALSYVERAHENDPTDCYTLIQRGRVLAARGDTAGAMESFTAALDRELRLPDVLAAMGQIELVQGHHEEAELYIERSIFLDPDVGEVHTLRGINFLMLGRARDAEEAFGRALAIDRTDPTADCGRAWCAYAQGDSIEAQTLFRELDDERRSYPEEDPYRVFARQQIERIIDHEEKVVWTDLFERQDIANDWVPDGEAVGPQISIRDGKVQIEGAFRATGRTRLKRKMNAADFVSFEAELTVDRQSRSRVGVAVSLEQFRRGEYEISSAVSISRNLDGTIQTRFMRRGQDDLPFADVEGYDWPAGEPVRLRLVRYGESSDTRFRIEVDGIPVIQDVPVPSMGHSTRELWISLFVDGEPGRYVSAAFDEVEIVRRER